MAGRYGYDGTEGIWFDTTKPIAGEEGQCEDRGQLYEEAEPDTFIPELQDRIAELEAQLERATTVPTIEIDMSESIPCLLWEKSPDGVPTLRLRPGQAVCIWVDTRENEDETDHKLQVEIRNDGRAELWTQLPRLVTCPTCIESIGPWPGLYARDWSDYHTNGRGPGTPRPFKADRVGEEPAEMVFERANKGPRCDHD